MRGSFVQRISLLLMLLFLSTSCRKEPISLQGTDLLKDLANLDLIADTENIDFGTASSRPHLSGKWSFDRRGPDGKSYAVGRPGELIIFYCVTPADLQMVVRMRMRGTPRDLKVVVNSRELGTVHARVAWEHHTFQVPADFLKEGVNHLRFETAESGGQLAMDYVAFRSVPVNPSPVEFSVEEHEDLGRILNAPGNSIVAAYVRVPPDAVLEVRYGMRRSAWWQRSSEQFSIRIDVDSGESREITTETLQDGWLSNPAGHQSVDLKTYAGKIVRILLKAVTVNGPDPAEGIYWKCAMHSSQSGPDREVPAPSAELRRPSNVIVYVIDALRPDHLQPYGYDRPTSPRIAEFASDAVIFENAYAQSSWTRGAVASILTGLYPSSHLVKGETDALSPSLPAFASEMKQSGFSTIAFMTNANLSDEFQFHRGFDHFFSFNTPKPLSPELFQSMESSKEVFHPEQPFFAYIHAMDPHSPYVRNIGPFGSLPDCKTDEEIFRGANIKEEKECAVLLYDREIYRSDFYFGKFLDLLKQKNLYENAMIMVTADHGEAFFEHGDKGHGRTLYEEVLRVPLLIKLPGNRYAGKRVAGRVKHIDLLPTVLESVGRSAPRLDGNSLLPVIGGAEAESSDVFSELLLFGENKRSMISGNYKLIASYPREARQQIEYELYDLRNDPGETQNLASDRSVLLGFLGNELQNWVDELSRKATLKKAPQAVIDKETEENLRALGYIQ